MSARQTTTLEMQPVIWRYQDRKIIQLGWRGFFENVPFAFIEGSGEQRLDDASSIVLTASTAQALFGDGKALGKVIRFDNKADLKVSAVIQDPPRNSTLQFECLIPFNTTMAMDPGYNRGSVKLGKLSLPYVYRSRAECRCILNCSRVSKA